MEPLVEIKNLSIRFPEGNSTFEAVKGISFSIGKGEIVGVVGESGSGKSMSALALMGLLPKDAEIAGRLRSIFTIPAATLAIPFSRYCSFS